MRLKRIPLFEPDIRLRYVASVARQMLSGYVGPGKAVEEFERLLCEHTGAKHAVVTTSGTTALMLALWASGARPDSTVLFPAYANLAGANAARLLGLRVKLADIDIETLCLPIGECQQMRGREDDTVIFVDHNGYCGTGRDRVCTFYREYGVPLIEDACQAFGVPGAGRAGDVGVFSFSVAKPITTGQGGALITDHPPLAAKLRQLRDQGGGNWRQSQVHTAIGGNFRMPDILAAYGIAQMQRLPELLDRREAIRGWYQEALGSEFTTQPGAWCNLLRSRSAHGLVLYLTERGIGAAQLYRPVHHSLPYFNGDAYPAAEQVARKLVYLPSSLTLKKRDVGRICTLIKRYASI